MYSDDSLHSEGMDILTFIDDIFAERRAAGGNNEHLYREYSVTVLTLPFGTDNVQPPWEF
jgi:hypothetical protein